jgi:signal transduction histidine kinase
VVRDGRAFTTPNVLDDPRVSLQTDSRVMIERAPYRSVLAVPLVVQHKVIGALSVGAAEGRMFTEAEVTVVHAFADQAAIAIENARLYRESTAHQRHLSTLVEVARKLTSQLDVSAVLDTVAEAAVEVFGSEVAFRLIEGGDLVVSRATPGALHRLVRQRLKIGESISGRVAATGEPIVTAEVSGDSRVIAEHRSADQSGRTDALMCVPIRGGSQILGTLNIYGVRGRLFDDTALNIAMSLADQAGVAIENARLYDEATRRRREAETLARIGVTLTESLDVSTVSQQIVDSARELLGTRNSALRLLETDGSLRGVAFGGAARQSLEPGHLLPAAAGVVTLAIEAGRPVWSQDWRTDPRLTLTEDLRQTYERTGVSSLLAVPLRAHGNIIGALTVGDVAGRRFSESEVALLQAFADQAAVAVENARLYREALEAYRQLSATQAQLVQSQKMEAIGRLAGGVAHDFNNLLTVIQGRSQLLLRRLPVSEASRRDITAISSTAERAATVTRQLLAFSRRQTLQPTVVDLNTVVSGVQAMLRQIIGEDIELEANIDPDDAGLVRVDRGQLEQVMVNLAVNARDAMPTGGRLVIETGRALVGETSARQSPGAATGPHVFLRVSDTGSGIDPAIQATIFEPFFTTKGVGQGTGLGLSMVDGIVKQHGGFVTVHSAPSQGATFTVYLPRAVDRSDVVGETVRWDGLRRGTETILLVEDDGDVRALAGEILEDAGFTVLAAATGAAALKINAQHEDGIDLLLTDVVMPGMSGTDLARAVCRARPDVRVLYMSGYPAHPSAQPGRWPSTRRWWRNPSRPKGSPQWFGGRSTPTRVDRDTYGR